MSVFGISAFVDGLFKGRQYRQEQDDKKYKREREQRLDEITFAREKREAEKHGLSMQYDQLLTEKAGIELDAARRDADNLAAYAKIAADYTPGTGTSLGTPGPASGMGAVSVSSSNQQTNQTPAAAAAQGVASNLGLELTMQDATRARQQAIPAGLGAVPAQAPAPANGSVTGKPVQQRAAPGLGAVGPTPAPAAAAAPAGTAQQPDARGSVVSVRGMDEDVFLHPNGQAYGMSTGQRVTDPQMLSIIRQQAMPNAPSAQAQANPLAPDYSHQWFQRGGLLKDAGEAAARTTAALDGLSEGIVSAPVALAGTMENSFKRGVNPLLRYAADIELPLNERGLLGPETSAASADAPVAAGSPTKDQETTSPLGAVPNPALGPRKVNSKQSDVAAMKSEAQTAADVGGPAAAVAVASAQNIIGQPLGAPGAGQMTEAQMERAAEDASEYYTNEIAKLQLEEMVRRGDVARAKEMRDYLETAQAQQATKKWATMVVAAEIGNMPVFAKHFLDLYNDLDLISDNTTVVPEKSSFSRNKAGEINGATLTFKDETNGNTWEMVIDDVEKLKAMGIAATAPGEFAKYHSERVAAAQESARGAVKDREKERSDLALEIFKASQAYESDSTKKITLAEADRQAEEVLRERDRQRKAAEEAEASGALPDMDRP